VDGNLPLVWHPKLPNELKDPRKILDLLQASGAAFKQVEVDPLEHQGCLQQGNQCQDCLGCMPLVQERTVEYFKHHQ